MDPSLASDRSYEGPCLSVSLCPNAWIRIARLGGHPCHKLTRPGAAFLCVTSLEREAVDAIRAWAVDTGLLEAVDAWRGHCWDEEADEWRWFDGPTREWAEAEVLSASGAECLEDVIDERGVPEGLDLVMPLFEAVRQAGMPDDDELLDASPCTVPIDLEPDRISAPAP
jgi:hypothetical protein